MKLLPSLYDLWSINKWLWKNYLKYVVAYFQYFLQHILVYYLNKYVAFKVRNA